MRVVVVFLGLGCPKSPMRESEGEARSEDEGVSSSGSREGMSLGCMGLVARFSLFLKDWELARVALSCHMALDMLCQEMHAAS